MLTDREIRAATPGEKAYHLGDGGGLQLTVKPTGSKLWHYRYEMAGKAKVHSIGIYPKVTLAAARAARDAAREKVAGGRDPNAEKKLARLASDAGSDQGFEAFARAWHAQQKEGWTPTHCLDVLNSLERFVFPELGKVPPAEITTPMVLRVLRAIEARPAVDTAHRVRQRMSAVFLYAIGEGACTQDPAAVVKPAMKPVRRGRRPAITELAEAREMLARAEAIPAHPITKLCLRLNALTALRPFEVRHAAWPEFDGRGTVAATWRLPAERMKMKKEHLAPLSREAQEVLDALGPLTGRCPLVFPSVRSSRRPISEATVNKLLMRSGYQDRHVVHGWRASFSTIMNERFPADRAVIDLMLAHVPKDRVEAAYNRAEHMARRRELAQEWASMLMEGRPPAAKLLEGARR